MWNFDYYSNGGCSIMPLDFKAILKAYPDAVTIDDGAGAFDKDGKSITLEQS